MPHILLLSLVFAPDSVSTSQLMTQMALDLQSLGHQVTVFTTTPHNNVEPTFRSRQPLKKRWGSLLYQSEHQGITIYHAAIPAKGSRVGARLLDYIRFHIVSTLAGLLIPGDYDIILTPSPPLTIGLSAWVLSLLRRIPYIYNVQEIYPDIAVILGVFQNPTFIRILEWVEQFVYARARLIVVISEWFRKRLLAKGVPDDKLRVIPNFVYTDFMQPGERSNSFSSTHDLDDKFVVLYAGNIGLTQDFDTVLSVAQALSDIPDLLFLIVGNGASRPKLEKQIADLKLANVTLLPYQPHTTIPEMYASSDIGLISLKKEMAHGTFPSKIYTIMAAGRPVITSCDHESDLTWIVEKADCGWAVLPEDSKGLEAAIREAYNQRGILGKLGANGRAYVLAHHTRQHIVSQYDLLIKDVLGSN